MLTGSWCEVCVYTGWGTHLPDPGRLRETRNPGRRHEARGRWDRARNSTIEDDRGVINSLLSPIFMGVMCDMKMTDKCHVYCQVTTVFAADAVARMSGTIGVAAVTAGPGKTLTCNLIKVWHCPVICYHGIQNNHVQWEINCNGNCHFSKI